MLPLLLIGSIALIAFFSTGNRWLPPYGWGTSPFGSVSENGNGSAATLTMIPVTSGLHLAVQTIPAAGQPRALAIILHGLCLNGSYYMGLANTLASSGITVAILDLHGHGFSEGDRGKLPPRNIIDTDLTSAIIAVAQSNPQMPLLLIGHSVGSELLISAAIMTQLEEKGLEIALLCGIAPYFSRPSTRASFNFRQPLFSFNPRGLFSQRWPLIRYNWPQTLPDTKLQTTFDKTLLKLLSTESSSNERLKEVSKPILLLVGNDDAIISPARVHALQSERVQVKRLPATDHMSIITKSAAIILEIFLHLTKKAQR